MSRNDDYTTGDNDQSMFVFFSQVDVLVLGQVIWERKH